MSQEKIIDYLKDKKGWITSTQIKEELHLSQSRVWKNLQSIRKREEVTFKHGKNKNNRIVYLYKYKGL